MDAGGGSGSNSPVWPIVDDNGAVDMNDTVDNQEERMVNLEMVFAYLKNKKMIERQENKPKKEIPSSDGTTSEDITEFEVASKSTSSTSKPKKVLYLDWPLILENQVTTKWCKLEAKLVRLGFKFTLQRQGIRASTETGSPTSVLIILKVQSFGMTPSIG
uniref:Uncharacterized protein n=1 Tax=Tanacetum cinerariifolium TaxID=118510 RepID=A0A6L2LBZ8_TANCI|nr:hypothetical protein [Tanacetum cinerariifolium]